MNTKLIWAMLLILVFTSCSEEDILSPLENNQVPPGTVENVRVENLPGKVRLTYTLPEDKDLLYVVAKYELENGTEVEVKSSYYNNSMLLEGFAGQSDRNVNLYAVNRSEIESEPVIVTVSPLEAPIFDVFESLEVSPDFGGIKINSRNNTNEDIALLVMEKNEQNDWEVLPNSIYTSASEISQSIRGFDTIPKEFAFVVRDRWLNTTDTLIKEIKPLYETLIPKSNYSAARLPNDAMSIENRYPINNLWDGEYNWYWGTYFTSRVIDVGSHLVTIDLGQKIKLSRIRIWDFAEPIGGQITYYYLGAMKHFRIWGSNELNDGDLSDWTLLGTYEVIKPSGLPYGQQTNEDYLEAVDGNDYEIPIEAPPVRYIRIESIENWSGGEFMAVSEIEVYGNPNPN